MGLIDFVGELFTLDPWLYRGWAYLLSSRYRSARHDAWKSAGLAYAIGDITLSAAIILAEVVAIILLVAWAIGAIHGSG